MPFGLINKSILTIKGEGSLDLLDGLITQNINILKPNKPIYSLFLNTQGKVLFSCIIYILEQNFIAIEIEDELLMDLAKHIHKHDISKSIAFAKADNLQVAISDTQANNFHPDPRSDKLPFRGLVEKNTLQYDNTFNDSYENCRLELTIPENNDFIKDKSLANDLNIEQLNGISFSKGCYLGQEITSKTKHIKSTKNKLVSLDNTKFKVSKLNCEVFVDDIKVGETFSFNSNFVLAIIKRNIEDLNSLIIK